MKSIKIDGLDLLRRFGGLEPLGDEPGELEPIEIENYPHYEERDRGKEDDKRGPAPIIIICILQNRSIQEGHP